jgi:hypothetical protein
MDPREVSAQFAAYTWYRERRAGRPPAEEEDVRFARENWDAFLPCAHEGLGRLLLRLAGRQRERGERRQGRRGLRLAG